MAERDQLSSKNDPSNPIEREGRVDAGVSYDDQLLLQSFLDDELSVRDADALERRLLEEPELRDTLELLRETRAQFTQWFDGNENGLSRKVDLWRKIESRIQEERVSNWMTWMSGATNFLKSPGPSNGAFAALAACLLGVIVFNIGSDKRTPEQPQNSVLASSTTSRPVSEEVPFQLVSSAQNPVMNEQGFRALSGFGEAPVRSRVSRDSGALPVGMAVQLFITPKNKGLRALGAVPVGGLPSLENRLNFMRSGVQTEGAVIDWARSDKQLKIVPAKSRNVPPIIWVADSAAER